MEEKFSLFSLLVCLLGHNGCQADYEKLKITSQQTKAIWP